MKRKKVTHTWKVGDTVYFYDIREYGIKCGKIEKFNDDDDVSCFVRPNGKKYSIIIRTANLYKNHEDICDSLSSFVTDKIEELKNELHGMYVTLKQIRRFKARHDKIKERNK